MQNVKSKIHEQAISEVKKSLQNNESNLLQFHTYEHIKNMLFFCEEAAEYYQCSNEQKDILYTAVAFHHSGLLENYSEFRKESIKKAKTFLEKLDISKEEQDQVVMLINSTRTPEDENLLSQIIYDAYWIFLGQKGFNTKTDLLRLEKENIENNKLSDKEWYQEILSLISAKNFQTEYAQENYNKRREKNIIKVTDNLKSVKNKKQGRGVETMYRAVYRNHINLSSIADAKANMMISINTIIMSVIITGVTGFSFTSNLLLENLQYTLPILLLLVASLASVIFAIISARPDVTSKKLDMEEFKRQKSSYLFFGNFVRMSKKKFVDQLVYFRSNQNMLYDDMSIDIYHLGHVLDKKYKLLRISYNIFMAGLIVCVLSFFVVLLILHLIV